MKLKLLLLLTITFFTNSCLNQNAAQCQEEKITVTVEKTATINKMGGLTLVAPPKPFVKNPMVDMQTVNADWVAVIPYGFTRTGEPKVSFNIGWQWWGEREAGVLESIRLAKAAGVNVMLKPQIYVPGDWTGTLDFNSAKEWETWEKGNTEYTLYMANLAEAQQVELFCFGTEFKNAIKQRPEYWVNLIRQVREIYKGKLTYASNWDNYHNIPFWSELDYVGINAYFPLCDTKTPKKEELLNYWKPVVKAMEDFQCTVDKPIIFTEFGYLSVDACASKTWELENKIRSIAINETAQAVALDALFTTFWEKDWWEGGFLWKWFPDMQGHEGYPDKDYTPQGKEAEEVVKRWYVN
ncbi:MAG: hypothetical protein AB8G11_04145 [Saprospiraceae bacterium]